MEVYYKNMDEVKILTRVHFQVDPVVSTVCVSLFFVSACVCCACFTCVCILHVCVLCMCACFHQSTLCATQVIMLFTASYHIPNQFSWKCVVLQNTFSHNLVERVKCNVNRDSPEDKLRDFMEWMKAVKKEMGHQV